MGGTPKNITRGLTAGQIEPLEARGGVAGLEVAYFWSVFSRFATGVELVPEAGTVGLF